MVKGFKHTAVGIIPSDWEVVPFSDIADKNKKWSITGGPFGSNLKTSDYTQTGVQIIQLQNIGDGIFHNDYQIFTSERKADELISNNIYPGELILSKMGDPVARTCFIPEGAKRYIMASDGIRLVVDERKFSKRFIYNYINSPFFRNRAFDASSGSTRLRIGLPTLKSLLVVKPPLSEQTAIAAVLTDFDFAIKKLESVISKKIAIKKGAMQELLKPEKSWQEKTLGQVATLKARIGWQGLTAAEYKKNGEYYLITGTEFKKGFVDWDSCFYVDGERYKQDKNIQIKKHDILVTKDGTIGKIALITDVPKPATLNSGVFVIRPINNSFYPEFFYYLLLSEIFSIFLSQLSAGSTINHLYQKDFITFKFYVPRIIEDQIKIAEILSGMDSEIQKLERQLDKYKMLEKGIAQSLLTGKMRLV